MKSGGYKVIDLKNVPLSNFAVNIPGIYEQIEASNKLCVVSGLYAGGIEYDDCAVLFTGGSTFTAKITDTLSLSVSENDNVTVNVIAPVSAMEYIDGSAYTINSSGSITDPNLAIKLLSLIAKKEPFYIKDLDLTKMAELHTDIENAHITVIPVITSSDEYEGGLFPIWHEDSARFVKFEISQATSTVTFTLI